ncbi:MAG TPA: YceI family protein [Elusimicrobiota bacterium]|nr:YceI family protein [Elusimicrobiota bacterium]
MNKESKRWLAGMLFAVLLAPAAHAGAVFNPSEPQSHLWLTGDSTLHPFTINATSQDFTLSFAKGTSDVAAALAAQEPATMTLTIPVYGLKSTESKSMDRNTQKALKAAKNPDITFTVTSYQAKPENGGYRISAQGRLSIAGVAKPETIEADAHAAKGGVTIDGQEPVSMSDFGVKPPTMMFGAIKVADRIVVHFHLNLKMSDTGENK